MENTSRKWRFKGVEEEDGVDTATVREVLTRVMDHLNPDDRRTLIHLGQGDPSSYASFRTTTLAVDAVVDALRSASFNGYAPRCGILSARKAVADCISRDLPYTLSPDDVFMTLGCSQAIQIAIAALARRPGANILLPRPGYPFYQACAGIEKIDVRYFDLLPEKGWEVDLDGVENLADENTVAMVIINPGNPCGNVYTYSHMEKVAETARKLGIVVISDEVYGHLCFGSNPFVPMAVFGTIVPVLTLGSISKRWIVPGWRIGWLVTSDPSGILHKSGLVDSVKRVLDLCPDPATFLQGALPQILGTTEEDFFSKIKNTLRRDADICCELIKGIPCITCPHKPEGAMSVMVKLNLSLLDDIIKDDLDFCCKLAKEECVIVLPGVAVGLKHWLRLTFAVEPSALEEGLGRINSFCQRHAKK